jgi:BirA family transcriptional regulator, biotin operon repressor / biotin---[acetyl-CoA-carboxylase] ligase
LTINDIPNTLFLGKIWQHFEELPSTNEFMANSPLNTEGVVMTTFNQTAGRGQMGNRWLAEPNQNLAYSIRLHPTFLQANEQFLMNKAVALAVHDLIDGEISDSKFQISGETSPSNFNSHCEARSNQTANEPPSNFKSHREAQSHQTSPVAIKWANDIFIGDKKVCGILIQNSLSGSRLQSSIIGIGVNINQLIFPKDINATSLRLETGQVFDLMPFVEKLTRCLEVRYLQLKSTMNVSKINDEYLSKMYRFGVDAIYRRMRDDSVFMGKIVGVSPTGQLEIMSNKGIELFDIKEVRFEI